MVVDCPIQLAQLLYTDLQTISNRAASWLVTFNPLKTLSMIISRKCNPVFYHSLFMNNTMIKNTSFHEHLGLTLSYTGSWDDHVKSISEKYMSMLNLLRALRFWVSRNLWKNVLCVHTSSFGLAILFGTTAR